jgi:periplasmic divalent cation tolerance protein
MRKSRNGRCNGSRSVDVTRQKVPYSVGRDKGEAARSSLSHRAPGARHPPNPASRVLLRTDILIGISSQPSTNDVLIVLTTWPDAEKARAAARTLVEEKLAACANIVPSVESIYRWQGNVETSAEVMAIFKTTTARYSALEARIRELHTYEVPEILSLRVANGFPDYLKWVQEAV